MRIIESFSEFINKRDLLMEAAGTDGYLLILASTDPQPFKSAANEFGLSQDTEYSGTLKGSADLLEIGKKLKFTGKLVKGGSVKPGEDFLEIETGGKKYSVKQSGSIEVPFTKDSELKVRGAGNGLLALARICGYLSECVDKGFDSTSPFTGTIFIKLKEKKRRGEAYFSNGKIEAPNDFRYGAGYVNSLNQFESLEFKGGEELNEGKRLEYDVIDVFSDTLADAIKAASFLANGKKWNCKWSAFQGFSDMLNAAEKQNFKWEGKTEEEINMDKASYLLSVAFHHYMNDLDDKKLPIDGSKVYNVDLVPIAKNIIKSQGKDLQKFDPASIKSGVEELIKTFALKKLPEYPEFTPKLPEYWRRLTSYITGRVLAEIPKTYELALSSKQSGQSAESKGGQGGGKRTYGSGKAN